jgi:Helix-turn-helix domain
VYSSRMAEEQGTRPQIIQDLDARQVEEERREVTRALLCYTPSQVAMMLQLKRRGVMRLLRDKQLKGFRIGRGAGGAWRIPTWCIGEFHNERVKVAMKVPATGRPIDRERAQRLWKLGLGMRGSRRGIPTKETIEKHIDSSTENQQTAA